MSGERHEPGLPIRQAHEVVARRLEGRQGARQAGRARNCRNQAAGARSERGLKLGSRLARKAL